MLACSLLRMHILSIHVYADERLGKHTERDLSVPTHGLTQRSRWSPRRPKLLALQAIIFQWHPWYWAQTRNTPTRYMQNSYTANSYLISYLFGGWGIGYITAVHRFLASANMFPSTPLKGRISQEACWTESSSSGKLQKMIKIISLAPQQALFKKSTNFIAHKPILFS